MASPTETDALSTADVASILDSRQNADANARDENEPYSLRVPISEIYADPKRINVRSEYNPAAMDRLTKSFERRGQLESVLVTPYPGPPGTLGPEGEKWLLIAGHRRYFAAKEAKQTHLIVLIRSFASMEDALAANLEENVNREDVSLFDTLGRVKEFVNKKYTAEQIADKCGAPMEICEMLVDYVENLAPEVLDTLRYDETPKTLLRMDLCKKVGEEALTKQDRFEQQVKWWKSEGWKQPKSSKPSKPRTASAEAIKKLASKIKVAQGLQTEAGWVRFSEEQANAVSNALEWCASPKGKKSPL